MTFIVSLAHFCEVHGPMMVMCTQTVKDSRDLPNFYSPQLPESQFCQSCMLIIPHKSSLATPSISTETTATTLDNQDAMSDSNGKIDGDLGSSLRTTPTLEDQIHNLLSSSSSFVQEKQRPMSMKSVSKRNSNTFFVSTQFPSSTTRYSTLRQIIVRVFTAETTADLNKPIMFGDSKQGYSIALSFMLTDKTARGSERKYSIIVTSNWERDIVDNYIFILTNLNKIVSNILKNANDAQKQLDNADLHSHDQYLRRSALKAKNMTDILNDENFFLKIHMWASFFLDSLSASSHD